MPRPGTELSGLARIAPWISIFQHCTSQFYTQSRRCYGFPADSTISGEKGEKIGRYKKFSDRICAAKVCSCLSGPFTLSKDCSLRCGTSSMRSTRLPQVDPSSHLLWAMNQNFSNISMFDFLRRSTHKLSRHGDSRRPHWELQLGYNAVTYCKSKMFPVSLIDLNFAIFQPNIIFIKRMAGKAVKIQSMYCWVKLTVLSSLVHNHVAWMTPWWDLQQILTSYLKIPDLPIIESIVSQSSPQTVARSHDCGPWRRLGSNNCGDLGNPINGSKFTRAQCRSTFVADACQAMLAGSSVPCEWVAMKFKYAAPWPTSSLRQFLQIFIGFEYIPQTIHTMSNSWASLRGFCITGPCILQMHFASMTPGRQVGK